MSKKSKTAEVPKADEVATDEVAEAGDEGLQMSFLDHLDELRLRLIRSVMAIMISFAVCFLFAKPIYNFLAVPVKQQLKSARLKDTRTNAGTLDLAQVKEGDALMYTFAQETAIGNVRIPQGTTVPIKVQQADGKLDLVLEHRWAVGDQIVPAGRPVAEIIKAGETSQVFGEEDKLVLRGVTSAFSLYIQVALYTGIALAIPFVLLQLWMFISPGLYEHEKKYATPVLVMGSLFFIMGASFAYKIAFPAACNYLLEWQTDGGFRTLLDAEDYFSLIIMIMLGLGLVFQLPVLAFLLGRLGLITAKMMVQVWRHAVVVIAIVSAVLTPTPDVYNMMMFMGPMLGLYLISIGVVWVFGKKRQSDEEAALASG